MRWDDEWSIVVRLVLDHNAVVALDDHPTGNILDYNFCEFMKKYRIGALWSDL